MRAVRDFWQTDLFHQPIPLSDFFAAYEDCRKKKRNTVNALSFELDYERNLIQLYNEVNSGTYHPGRSVAFIIDKPVKREIFAADFRDRVIHHLIIGKLNRAFEKQFINDSYSCRCGKGMHFAVHRLDHFVRSCSRNYTRDCYILKLDISGFFMHIDRERLWRRLSDFIDSFYEGFDVDAVKYLVKKTVLTNPAINCVIKGKKSDWEGLPASKSIFSSPKGCGLPIGNLTSQVFANFYMNPFDHYVKATLGLKYYGRYVDDFVIVHESKEYLRGLIPKLADYLRSDLGLVLHPRKVYLQHYSHGVKYLGCVVMPYRIYIANRTKGNLYQAIEKYNEMAKNRMEDKGSLLNKMRSSMNSYLGIMSHYSTYSIRKREIYNHLSDYWFNKVAPKNYCKKIVL